MKHAELKEFHNRVKEFVINRQIKDAFDVLSGLAEQCRDKDLSQQLNAQTDIYRNILKYSFEMGDDPEKEKVYAHLQKSILDLADDIKEDILYNQHLISYYRAKPVMNSGSVLSEQESLKMADNLTFRKEIEYILEDSGEDIPGSSGQSQEYKRSLNNIFQLILLTDKLRDAEISLVKKINEAKIIPWYDKSILVSALTLSLIRHFDPSKVNLLFDFYENMEEQVWERALIGLFVGFYFHDDRLSLYPEIVQRLKVVKDNKKLQKSMESVIIQFLKAKETEKVTKKIREEILPEMIRMKSTLDEKLDLEDIISAKSFEDKNPDWETVFKDSPDLYSKIEQFSSMQMEGADVFMSAFSMLKRFNFFNYFNNWFLPFHRENEEVIETLDGESDSFDVDLFMEGLERSSFLCNSDKYSFCLNIKYLPSQQKNMMMELFNMELKAMNEMEQSDELLDNTLKERTIYTQYLQDLYRFHKLHPIKNEFDDVFSHEIDLQHSNLFRLLIEDASVLRNIGEFYFEKGYFDRVIKIFEGLCISEENAELFEKTAYSYQNIGEFRKALEYYHKAEFFNRDKEWLLKKIAYCYRKLGEYDNSLEYYQQIQKLNPDDLQIQTFIGHTYLDREDYEEALKYYFKVEYMDPDNHKIYRPIAWSSFVLGKFDTAEKYFLKAAENDENKNDYMNLGHVEWCRGNKGRAIEMYMKSIQIADRDMEWYTGVMKEDTRYLVRYGIKEFDIPLMIDYLKINA